MIELRWLHRPLPEQPEWVNPDNPITERVLQYRDIGLCRTIDTAWKDVPNVIISDVSMQPEDE